MSQFLLRRLALSIPVLIGILFVTFVLNRSIPGDPCRAMLGEKASDESCDRFLKRYGFDQPIPVQFVIYIGNALQGDLGMSLRQGRPVAEIIAERLPVTMELSIMASIFAILLGIPLGIISAYRHNSIIDVGSIIGANVGVSVPVFWLGLMLQFFFAVILKDSPFALPPSGRLPAGYSPVPFYEAWGLVTAVSPGNLLLFLGRIHFLNALLTIGNPANGELLGFSLRHMLLPSIAVGTIPLAIIARMTRSSVLEILGQDYVRTARAKGLNEMVVVLRHAVRNALLPVVTIIGLNFGGLISGAILTETVFGFAGIGRTLFESITARDYAVVQGVAVITAVAFVMINLFVDVLYGYLDPRIRLS